MGSISDDYSAAVRAVASAPDQASTAAAVTRLEPLVPRVLALPSLWSVDDVAGTLMSLERLVGARRGCAAERAKLAQLVRRAEWVALQRERQQLRRRYY